MLHDNWRALSIQQPWVDLILRRLKTIEVRYWKALQRRGKFLIHASSNVDWKTTDLLGFDEVLELPLQRIVGYAEIKDVLTLFNESRIARLTEHWVMHPFNGEPLGAILSNATAFKRPIACKGKQLFFRVPEKIQHSVSQQLLELGIDPTKDPSETTSIVA